MKVMKELGLAQGTGILSPGIHKGREGSAFMTLQWEFWGFVSSLYKKHRNFPKVFLSISGFPHLGPSLSSSFAVRA